MHRRLFRKPYVGYNEVMPSHQKDKSSEQPYMTHVRNMADSWSEHWLAVLMHGTEMPWHPSTFLDHSPDAAIYLMTALIGTNRQGCAVCFLAPPALWHS